MSIGSRVQDQVQHIPNLEDLPDLAGKRVLVRATLDLPLGIEQQAPMARHRARALRSTLRWLADKGAQITVCGDAGGSGAKEEAERFGRVRELIESLVPGVVVADDTAGGGASAEDPAVIESLVGSHDLFVNDSFQWSHLPLPSLLVPPSRLPSAIGRSLQRDLEAVVPMLQRLERPFTAAVGGDRPYLRLHGMEGLVLRADIVLVGGAMAIPFLQAVGRQPVDGFPDDFLAECRRVYGLGESVSHHIELPTDLVWARTDGTIEVTAPGEQPGGRVVDIGPRTRRRFAEFVEGAGTLFWIGALGQVEVDPFAAGTRAVASALGSATTVVGGDALMSFLHTERLLSSSTQVISATDPALELLKTGDLAALIALRAGIPK